MPQTKLPLHALSRRETLGTLGAFSLLGLQALPVVPVVKLPLPPAAQARPAPHQTAQARLCPPAAALAHPVHRARPAAAC